MFLGVALGRAGRTDEAREHLHALLGEFDSDTLALFQGFTLGVLGWLDVLDGRYASALALATEAYESSLGPLSMMIGPQMPAMHLIVAAWALAGLGGPEARTGAVLLGARDGLLPPGHLPPPTEREQWGGHRTRPFRTRRRGVRGGTRRGRRPLLRKAAALLGRAADAIRERAES